MPYAVITVSLEEGVTDADLDAEDTEIEGVYGLVMGSRIGAYSPVPRNPIEPGDDPLIEAALDVFHDKIAIHCLDHFRIEVSIHEDDAAGEIPEDIQII